MSYIASLLTDEWRDGLMHECQPYRLLTDGAGSLQIARNGHDAIENVGVELQVHMIKYGAQVSSLLSHDDTPFFVMALCKRDLLAPPVALDLYVNAPLFEREMQRVGTVPGENAVVEMLTTATRYNLLLKRFQTATASSDRHVSKRARTLAAEPFQTTAELLQRVLTREHSTNTHVGMPMFITIPGSQYVFCLKEFAFVPQSYGTYETVQVNAGAVVGDRGANKTELVKQLIERTRSEPLGTRRSTPPFLRAVKATLLVVPTALVEQWQSALAPTCRVVVVLNKRMLHQLATFASVAVCDVVLVTHVFYLTCMRKTTTKHKARVCARAPLAEIAHQYCRLDWVFWKRVIFDEALHFYMYPRKAWHSVARGKMVWLLQGGSEVTSLDACALMDFMVQHTNFTRPCFMNVSALALDCFLRATTVQCRNAVQVDTVCTTLTSAEAQAYAVLQQARSSLEELMQVAAGDLAPIKKFMHPVSTWAAALPLGTTILNSYIESVVDAEFVWSEVDDNEEDDDDGEASPEEATEAVQVDQVDDAVEVEVQLHVDVDDISAGSAEFNDANGDHGEHAGEHARAQGSNLPLRHQLDEMLDDMVDATTDEMKERLEFFKRAGSELDSGAMEASCCSVCLTNTSDCLFVCGHMLCHECVVHLFINSKKKELQELAEQGVVATAEGYLAQCPQCRWQLEPHEVFWKTGVTPQNEKRTVLCNLLKRLVAEEQSILVVATMPEVLMTLLQCMCEDGLPCKPLTYSPIACRHALTWFKASAGRVLFVYADQLNGLKLPSVQHVVLLHPHVHGRVQQQVVQDAVLDCINNGDGMRTIQLHRLCAGNTIEEATIDSTH